MIFKDDGQDYGTVVKILGNSRMTVRLPEGPEFVEKQCSVRGSMRRREWVHVNDIVLVAYRDFGDQHDIIRRYTEDEAAYLKKIGEIVVTHRIDEDDEDDIVFDDVDDI